MKSYKSESENIRRCEMFKMNCKQILNDGTQCQHKVFCKEYCCGHYRRLVNNSETPMDVPVGATRRKANMTNQELREWIEEQIEEKDGCKIWTGTKNPDGRSGIIKFNKITKSVRRCYYELVMKRELTDAELVLSSCNNPLCLSLDCLFIGDHSDLIRLRWERGEMAVGYNFDKRKCIIDSCKNKRTSKSAVFCDECANKLVPKPTRVFEYEENANA